jgi:hypothetical protein
MNGDLATDFGVGANSQIATGPFWPGWPFLLLLIPVTRYERYAGNFLAMLHLACCLILLRGL